MEFYRDGTIQRSFYRISEDFLGLNLEKKLKFQKLGARNCINEIFRQIFVLTCYKFFK